MDALELLSELRLRNVSVREAQGDLVYRAPEGAVTNEMLDALRLHKQAVLHLLRSRASRAERIPLRETNDAPVLSLAQERLWFFHQMTSQPEVLNIPLVLELTGPLDRAALERGFRSIVADHEILRTRFEYRGGQPRPCITDGGGFSLVTEDLSVVAAEKRDAALTENVHACVSRPFDPSDPVLMRANLLTCSQERHVLVVVLSHLVADAASVRLLIAELQRRYQHEKGAQVSHDASRQARSQFAAFAAWQQARLAAGEFEPALNYWRTQLGGRLPVLRLAADFARPDRQDRTGAAEPINLGAERTSRVRVFARENDVSPYVVLLSAFLLLMHRMSGDEDIVIGSPSEGRDSEALRNLLGPIANILTLRNCLAGRDRFDDVLRRVKRTCLEALAHEVPFELILQALRPERSPQHNPFFQVMFDVQLGGTTQPIRLGNISARPLHFDTGVCNFDLHLSLVQGADEALGGVLLYQKALFAPATAREMVDDFLGLIDSAIAAPERTVDELLAPRGKLKETVTLAANFRADPLLQPLEAWIERLGLRARVELLPESQIEQQLLDSDSNISRNRDGLNILLVSPCRWSGRAEQDEFLAALRGRVASGNALWCVVLADKDASQTRQTSSIVDALTSIPGVVVKDFSGVATSFRLSEVLEPEADAMAGVPYTEDYFLATATHLARALRRRRITPPKVIVVDCDYTLWEGACSECACSQLIVDDDRRLFQRRLLEQVSAGALLCLCSRNGDEEDVLRVLREHPRMLIRPEHVTATRINLLEKSRNLASLARELGVSLSSFLFIDDDALECAEVERHLPDVLWMRFPRAGEAISAWVNQLWVLDVASSTAEASERTRLYRHQRQREDAASRYDNLGEFLDGIGLQVHVTDAGGDDLERVAELTARTNQFNVAKVPLDVPQLARLREAAEWRIWIARVTDRYGSYGTVGVILARFDGRVLSIEQLLLSCRAMNRCVEHTMLLFAARWAREQGGDRLAARFRPSAVNQPAGRFLQELAGEEREIREACTFELPLGVAEERLSAARSARLEKPFRRQDDAGTATPSVPTSGSPPPNGGLLREIASELVDAAAIRRLIRRRSSAQIISTDYAPPVTEEERLLAETLSAHLDVERIGVNDNLFALGIDSLKLLQVVVALREKGIRFSIEDFFQHQTIRALLSREYSEGSGTPREPSEPFSGLTLEDRALAQTLGAEDAYPFSSMQSGMIFHAERDSDASLYQVIDSFRLRGAFDEQVFRDGLQRVVQRHAALRTSFHLAGFSRALQVVHDSVPVPLEIVDLRPLSPAAQLSTLDEWLRAQITRRFEITRPPLVRYAVHLLSDSVFQVTITQHHAILDGWSLNSLVRELLNVYAESRIKGSRPLPPAPTPLFSRFIEEEQRALVDPHQKAFWSGYLKNAQVSVIPRWPEAGSATDIQAKAQHVVLPYRTTAQLFSVARQAGVPIKSLLLAAHLRVVSLLTGRREVMTGLLVNGRPVLGQADQVLGLFVNSVPLRATLRSGNWLELIRQAFECEAELQSYKLFPLAELQRLSGIYPLFEILFTFTHFHVLEPVRGRSDIEVLDTYNFVRDNFPLQAFFDVDPFNARHVRLMLAYDATRIVPRQLEQIATLYREVLDAIALDPCASLIEGARPARAPESELPPEPGIAPQAAAQPIAARIGAVSRQYPDKIAVACGDECLTFGALNRHAESVARQLRAKGASAESIVAVTLTTSVPAIVAFLGVLKAGAAYLPIDPGYPRERREWMCADSKAALVIASRTGSHDVVPADAEVLFVEDLLDAARKSPGGSVVQEEVEAERLAYVIYTSGSTGKPKGVMISQGTLAHLFDTAARRFELRADDVCSLFHSFSFDYSVWEMWAPLVRGARLVLVPPDDRPDMPRLARYVGAHGVTVLSLTPSVIARLLDEPDAEQLFRPDALRALISGGEELPHELGQRLQGTGVPLWNFYGPTEATVWTSAVQVRSNADLGHLGRPFENLELRVLNGDLQAVPTATPGEIFIGGSGLARGYHRRPALTAERFIPDPSAASTGSRLYRTGDLGRTLPEGVIQFLGRADHQIKFRGYRIELGEIEAAMLQHPAVGQAVVLASMGADATLIGFYTVRQGVTTPNPQQFRQLLSEKLPPQMLPGRLVSVDAIPLAPNGKIDRATLLRYDLIPEPARADIEVSLLSADELRIAEFWRSVLEVEVQHPGDDFFALGGDSIRAARVTARVRFEMASDVPLREIFQHSTLRKYAMAVARHRGPMPRILQNFPSQRAGLRRAPLTYAQRRLWLVDQLTRDKAAYNVPLVFEYRGGLSIQAVRIACRTLIERRPILAVRFEVVNGEPWQEYLEPDSVVLNSLYVSAATGERHEALMRVIESEIRAPFDLSTGPCIRLSVLQDDSEHGYIVAVLHHIVTDAWSVGILRREFAECYSAALAGRAPNLADPPIDYFDYAAWQNAHLREDALREASAYWRSRLAEPAPPVSLGPPPSQPPLKEALSYSLSLDVEQCRALSALARTHHVTLFSLLLAAFKVALHALSGQTDLSVGSGVANRLHAHVADVVGFFVNMLVLRTRIDRNTSFSDYLQQVSAAVLEAQEHGHMPFEELVRLLNPERDRAGRPLFGVLFELHNAPNPVIGLPDVRLNVVEVGSGLPKYDISLQIQEVAGALTGTLEVDARRYQPERAQMLLRRFRLVLQEIVKDANVPINRFSSAGMLANAATTREAHRARLVQSFEKALLAREARTPRGPLRGARQRRPGGLPLVVERQAGDAPLETLLVDQRQRIEADLHRQGAILFRGFGVDSAEGLGRIGRLLIEDLILDNGEHEPVEGVSAVQKPVFYAPDSRLLWHNENTFNDTWPTRIIFGCGRPAARGGETPLVDCREIFDRLPPRIRDAFVDKGVMYVRNFGAGVGVSWQKVFGTSSRELVEKKCRGSGFAVEWRPNGSLRTRCVRPAACAHPVTGEWVWCNQAQHWHPACLEPTLRTWFAQTTPRVEDFPRSCFFGDGSVIPDSMMQDVLSTYAAHEHALGWQKGDVMVIDNLLVAHGRLPYAGERTLYVALGGSFRPSDVRQPGLWKSGEGT